MNPTYRLVHSNNQVIPRKIRRSGVSIPVRHFRREKWHAPSADLVQPGEQTRSETNNDKRTGGQHRPRVVCSSSCILQRNARVADTASQLRRESVSSLYTRNTSSDAINAPRQTNILRPLVFCFLMFFFSFLFFRQLSRAMENKVGAGRARDEKNPPRVVGRHDFPFFPTFFPAFGFSISMRDELSEAR